MEARKAIKDAVKNIVDYYRDNGFERTTVWKVKKLGNELLEYLTSNELEGSESDLNEWLTLMLHKYTGTYAALIRYNRYVHLVLKELTGGFSIYPHVGFLRKAKTPYSGIWQHVLEDYLLELKKEEKAKATIYFSQRACTKFITYLEQQGCLDPVDLSRELVLRYQNETEGHTTANGKRAYLYRIRFFIRYLERKELVERTLEFAVTTRYRIPQKVVTTVLEEQRQQIHTHRKSRDPLVSRAYAMAILALYLGLRSSDILNLRFSRISWEQNTITIVQQKTKTTQVLPLIPVAGNAIAEYVLHHRPASYSPYVFVSHYAPFGRLTKSACYNGTIRLLGKQSNKGDQRGLHILRRTFATQLLRNHVKHELVSSILGHTGPESINSYLSLDEQRIGRCSLNLKLVGNPEVYR